jgi:large subunit ribosomal protein L4
MLTVELKSLTEKKPETKDLKLDSDVFGLKRNDELIHQVYLAQYSNCRQVLAHTKTRGERVGSGKKPWKQKGTGRARVGTASTPIWRKGGIVFGPRNDRNFKKKVNLKMKRAAIKMVLSGKVADKELVVVEKNEIKDNKTKNAVKFVDKITKTSQSVLWVFSKEDAESKRAIKNLKNVTGIMIENLSVLNMLNNKYLIFSKEEVKMLEARYGKKDKQKKEEKK